MNQRILAIELLLSTLTFTAILLLPLNHRYTRLFWSWLNRIARKPRLSAIIVGLLALVLRAALIPIVPIPQPMIHDEFSYLLAADTFAAGRLANPPHPLWEHFESFHINQQPTYASMYPPAQGTVLYAGKLLTGFPWVGVLFSNALMCSVLVWTLQGWLPARWALLGGIIAVIRIATLSYWGNSYWGGAVAASGGLIVLGVLPRLSANPLSIAYRITMCVGILILANSRPYEGLLLTFGVIGVFVAQHHNSLDLNSRIRALASALLIFGVILTVVMAYYNWRVTGHLTNLPYQVNQQTYAMAPAFLWQHANFKVTYHHKVMEDFYELYLKQYLDARASITGITNNLIQKMTVMWLFYLGPAWSIALFGLPKTILDRRVKSLLAISVVAIAGMSVETWSQPHYAAPFLGITYLLLLQSLRHLRTWRFRGSSVGQTLALSVPMISVIMFMIAVISLPGAHAQGKAYGFWCCSVTGPSDRSRLIATLQAQGGEHLVIVRYRPDHDVNDDEWVYNDANIDKSSVVFGRDMGDAENEKLINYFRGRKVWLLSPDDHPLRLMPYADFLNPMCLLTENPLLRN